MTSGIETAIEKCGAYNGLDRVCHHTWGDPTTRARIVEDVIVEAKCEATALDIVVCANLADMVRHIA